MTSPCLFATQSPVTAGGRRLKKSGRRLSPPGSYMRPGRDLRRGRHRQVLVNPRRARSRPQTQQINEVNSMATTVVRMPVQVELAGRRITYECQYVGEYFADIFVEDVPLVELKCVERLANEHTAQCLNYLRASGRTLLSPGQFPKAQSRVEAYRPWVSDSRAPKTANTVRAGWRTPARSPSFLARDTSF